MNSLSRHKSGLWWSRNIPCEMGGEIQFRNTRAHRDHGEILLMIYIGGNAGCTFGPSLAAIGGLNEP